MTKLIIEICPREGRASPWLPNGESVTTDSEVAEHLADCRASGDAAEACQFVRDYLKPEFRIVARNAQGDYENRLATDDEMVATCREIYFESDTDFDDMVNVEMYLIWQAASEAEAEGESED